jgi:hypothetical protein
MAVLVSYVKTAWVNGVPPAINATNLNKIEQGLEDLVTRSNACYPKDGTEALTADLDLGGNDVVSLSPIDFSIGGNLGLTVDFNRINVNPNSAPPVPIEGDIYADSISKELKYYNGTAWVTLTNAGTDRPDILLNNTHRSSDGSDHTFIDQGVTAASSPVFAGLTVRPDGVNDNMTVQEAFPQLTVDRGDQTIAGFRVQAEPLSFVEFLADSSTVSTLAQTGTGQHTAELAASTTGGGSYMFLSTEVASAFRSFEMRISPTDIATIKTSPAMPIEFNTFTSLGFVPNASTTRLQITDDGLIHTGRATAPTTPSDGTVYHNSTTNTLEARLNGAWVDLSLQPSDLTASDISIVDSGSIITATEVEGALQENRAAINLNTAHSGGDGSDHSAVALNTTHRGSDGKDHSDVVLNNAHRVSDGSDHTFINQSVTTTSGPTFNDLTVSTTGVNITGLSLLKGNLDVTPDGTNNVLFVQDASPHLKLKNGGGVLTTRFEIEGPNLTGGSDQIYFEARNDKVLDFGAMSSGGNDGASFVIGPSTVLNNRCEIYSNAGGYTAIGILDATGSDESYIEGALGFDFDFFKFGTLRFKPDGTSTRLSLSNTDLDAFLDLDMNSNAVVNASNVNGQIISAATIHGAFTDDDHTIYPLLAGRATGQTLYGGTAASDDLVLVSTSNASKGQIVLGDKADSPRFEDGYLHSSQTSNLPLMQVTRNFTPAGVPVVIFDQDHASDTGDVMRLDQDGTGKHILLGGSGAGGIDCATFKITNIGATGVGFDDAANLDLNNIGRIVNIGLSGAYFTELSGLVLYDPLDMNSNVITEIGNAGTNFTSGGGLTLADILTVSSGGASITGTLNMNNSIISNIGAAGTDFTATGGLTLADALAATLAADPGSPAEGALWYNSTDDKLRYYDGTVTQTVTKQADVEPSYGSLYEYNDTGFTDITIVSAGTYYQWVSTTVGETKGAGYVVGSASTDDLTIGTSGAGKYKIDFNTDFLSHTSDTIKWGVFVNDTRENELTSSIMLNDSPRVIAASITNKGSGTATGTIAALAYPDGTYWNVTETTQDPPIDVEITFDNLVAVETITFIGAYDGSGAHGIDADIRDHSITPTEITHSATNYKCLRTHTSSASDEPGVGSNWRRYWEVGGAGGAGWVTATPYTGDFVALRSASPDIPNTGDVTTNPEMEIVRSWSPPGGGTYVSSGTATVRLSHTLIGGTGTHVFYIDHMCAQDVYASGSVSKSAILTLASTDTVDLRVTSSDTGDLVKVSSADLTISRIST